MDSTMKGNASSGKLFTVERIQVAKKQIEKGDREGSFAFKTKKDLFQYLNLSIKTYNKYEQKILKAGFFVEGYIGRKIRIGKERVESSNRESNFGFESAKELYEFLGVQKETYQVNKQKILDAGFFILTTEEKIRIAKEKIEKEDRDGDFEFETAKELFGYIGIGAESYRKHKQKILDAGFSVLTAEEKIRIAKEKIEEEDRDGGLVFGSAQDFCEYVGMSHATYYNRKQIFLDAGFVVEDFLAAKIKTGKEKILADDSECDFVFKTARELMEFLDISETAFYNHKKEILDAGFSFLTTEEKIRIAKEKIEEGDRESSFEFETERELSEYVGVTVRTYANNMGMFLNAGFYTEDTSVEKKIRVAKEKIEKGDRKGNLVFRSVKAFCEYSGVSRRSFQSYEEKILDYGFSFGTVSISKNARLTIEDCRSNGIKMENIELLPLLSQEFFSRSIRKDIKQLEAWNGIGEDITYQFSKEEKVESVKTAIFRLLAEDKSNYSMLEIKFELFMDGKYLSEDSIVNALVLLGEDIDGIMNDNIYKRLRLGASFVENGFIQIDYIEELPMINNSADGNVMMLASINGKQDFMRLWREYAEFSIKNHITGHVSKTKIPDDWSGNLDELFEKIPSYQKAYLLDDKSIGYLEEFGYEGVLAMCQFASKQSKKGLTKMYQSIHARFIGFFLYLNRKGLSLFQPKYLIFTGANSVSDIAKKILENHVVLDGFKKILKDPDTPLLELNKFTKKSVPLHGLKFAASVRGGCDLGVVPSEDIYAYLEHNAKESISGTILHETFVLTLLRLLGNRGAIEKNKTFDIDEEISKFLLNTKASKETLADYRQLRKEMCDVVKNISKKGQSHPYAKSYLKHIFILMEFLSIFPKKLTRKEMANVLNTVIISEDRMPFEEWASTRLTDAQYVEFTNKMHTLFYHIKNEQYKGLYSREWRASRKQQERALIREGMGAEEYEFLQHLALYDPPNAKEYPFRKTTPEGENLDLSWWGFNFSPIPVICNWLIIKTTRRKIAVRHLDVHSFFQYDEHGKIKSMFINTDKNRKSHEQEISIHLLRYIFSDEELSLLEKYVKYIKNAYSDMAKVSYENTGAHYEKIMPLFPHHNKNAVISDTWVDGYFNKTMLKTEIKIKKHVADGEFDHLIEEHDREQRKEALLKTRLLFKKDSTDKEIPRNLDELDNYTINSYTRFFTTKQGIHNMRHSGISALGAEIPLVYVRMIAGHSDIYTTARVYFHANDEIVAREVLGDDQFALSDPARRGSEFIRGVVMPIVESDDPEMIMRALKENNFMSCSREVTIGKEKGRIGNGLERASELNPGLWIANNFGICPNNQQCPAETWGCCGLCPLYIFSPMHIRGVIYKLNKCMLDITLLTEKVAMDATRNVNTTREELRATHQQKMKEMIGWSEVLDLINEKISQGGNAAKKDSSLVRLSQVKNNLFSYRKCSVHESMMDLLVEASDLKIDDVDTDNSIARITNEMFITATIDYDMETSLKISREGIKWFVDEYGKKTFEERREYLLQHISVARGDVNPAFLGNRPKHIELLSGV